MSFIGRATAERLAADGATVIIDYIGDPTSAEALVSEIEADRGRALAVRADVSDEHQVDTLFQRLVTSLDQSTCPSTTLDASNPMLRRSPEHAARTVAGPTFVLARLHASGS